MKLPGMHTLIALFVVCTALPPALWSFLPTLIIAEGDRCVNCTPSHSGVAGLSAYACTKP